MLPLFKTLILTALLSAYVPPRSVWTEHEPTEPGTSQNPILTRQSPSPLGHHIQPLDLTRPPRQARPVSGANYYEDVDPRFAYQADNEPANIPSGLTPGGGPSGELRPKTSFDDLPEGARSPATSEISHYTSISQRGINPKWRPPEVEANAKVQKRRDVLLGNNPDFELPGARGRGNGPGGRMPMPGM